MMPYQSGLFYLDGGGIELSSDSEQTIAGSWARAKAAVESQKAILAYNCKYNEAVLPNPIPVFPMSVGESSIILVGATLHITITSANKCTVLDVAGS